eukprot:CAMPEP_0172855090 /NCGR_PEP_ID=MMETSP1075-20121228/60071_1 /TAXON_ID=2916 /ORGANISM="Ceratium fusus, Strain PA161109" /LENGTH=106 /DNA_ID=CAMNT_0013701923 /DNA_START=60 /DNA_END=377 /DNA_ORIENTATION=+
MKVSSSIVVMSITILIFLGGVKGERDEKEARAAKTIQVSSDIEASSRLDAAKGAHARALKLQYDADEAVASAQHSLELAQRAAELAANDVKQLQDEVHAIESSIGS